MDKLPQKKVPPGTATAILFPADLAPSVLTRAASISEQTSCIAHAAYKIHRDMRGARMAISTLDIRTLVAPGSPTIPNVLARIAEQEAARRAYGMRSAFDPDGRHSHKSLLFPIGKYRFESRLLQIPGVGPAFLQDIDRRPHRYDRTRSIAKLIFSDAGLSWIEISFYSLSRERKRTETSTVWDTTITTTAVRIVSGGIPSSKR